jgi:hypothetical protein
MNIYIRSKKKGPLRDLSFYSIYSLEVLSEGDHSSQPSKITLTKRLCFLNWSFWAKIIGW